MVQPSIIDLPRRPADHRETIAQIGKGARMNLGARDFVQDDANGLLQFRIGDGRVHRKALVILTADDLYAVEIGRVDRRTFDWIVEANAQGVYADQLADTLIRLHHQAVYG